MRSTAIFVTITLFSLSACSEVVEEDTVADVIAEDTVTNVIADETVAPDMSALEPGQVQSETYDFRLPNGTLVTNVPWGTTQAEIFETLERNGYDRSTSVAETYSVVKGTNCIHNCDEDQIGFDWPEEQTTYKPYKPYKYEKYSEAGSDTIEEPRPYRTRSSTRIGNTTFYNDGDSSTDIGSSTFYSDGTSSTRIGKSTFHSDGTSSTRIGNSTFHSDGTSSTRIGNSTFHSDGTACSDIGNSTFC